MACCGGRNRSQVVRSQRIVKNNAPKTVLVQNVSKPKNTAAKQLGSNSINKLSIVRQKISPSNKCPKCGYPIMIVNNNRAMAKRCSNANCNHIIPK